MFKELGRRLFLQHCCRIQPASPSMSEAHNKPKSGRLLQFSVVISCAIIALGVYGFIETFQRAHGHWSVLEVAEKTVGLFEHEQVVFVKGEELDQHWTLAAARGLTKVLILTLAGAGTLSLFGTKYRTWRFRNVSGHTVFIGIGSRGNYLALRALSEGRVAVIDLNENNPHREALLLRGALFLSGSGADASLLRAARAAFAARVVILTESDDANSQIAEKVVGEWQSSRRLAGVEPPEVLVSVASTEYRELLRERWDLICNRQRGGPVVKLLGFRSVALRGVLLEMALEAGLSSVVRGRGPSVLVAGDCAFVEEFMKLAVAFLQISGLNRPQFIVCTSERDLAGEFTRRYPAVSLVAGVRFIEDDPVDVAWAEGLEGTIFDFAVVALSTEANTLFVAERVLRSSRFSVSRVTALVQSLPGIRVKSLEKMQVISMFEQGCKSAEFGEAALESEARASHEAYLAGLGPNERASDVGWDDLSEGLKESNRWGVLHGKVKRRVWDASPGSERSALFEHLAQSEHARWMGEKVMDGWRGGGSRDNIRRIHPDLRPYSELSEEGREKDRVQVRRSLGMS